MGVRKTCALITRINPRAGSSGPDIWWNMTTASPRQIGDAVRFKYGNPLDPLPVAAYRLGR
jgi:hypothetical protein